MPKLLFPSTLSSVLECLVQGFVFGDRFGWGSPV